MKGKCRKITAALLAAALTLTLALAPAETASQKVLAEEGNTVTITLKTEEGQATALSGNTYVAYKIASFEESDEQDASDNPIETNITLVAPFNTEELSALLEAAEGTAKDSTEALALAKAAAAVAAGLDSSNSYAIRQNEDQEGSVGFTVEPDGYYLIIETSHGTNAYLSTKYLLVVVESKDVEATVKVSDASVEKKIVSEHSDQYEEGAYHDSATGSGESEKAADILEDANTVAIGDTVTYLLTATIPDYDSEATYLYYVLTDTLSKGLTYKNVTSVEFSEDGKSWLSYSAALTTCGYSTDSVTADNAYKVTGTGEENAVVANEEDGTTTIYIQITSNALLRAYSYVRIVMTATLNESANVGSTGNANAVKLTYSTNYYGDGSEGHEYSPDNPEEEDVPDIPTDEENPDDDFPPVYDTPEDAVITYTGEFLIYKTDTGTESTEDTENSEKQISYNPLSGAEFTIYKEDVASTVGAKEIGKDESGDAIYGIALTFTAGTGDEEGTYTLSSASGASSTVTTGTDGKITLYGLDIGSYYAVETKAPSGYGLDQTPVEITLSVASVYDEDNGNGWSNDSQLDDNGDSGVGDKIIVPDTAKTGANQYVEANYTVSWTVNNTSNDTVQIENEAGSSLPVTGGIGTTLFTLFGLLLIVSAAAALFCRRKKAMI